MISRVRALISSASSGAPVSIKESAAVTAEAIGSLVGYWLDVNALLRVVIDQPRITLGLTWSQIVIREGNNSSATAVRAKTQELVAQSLSRPSVIGEDAFDEVSVETKHRRSNGFTPNVVYQSP